MGTRSDTDSCIGAYTPFSSATNWDIAGGSLSDSITFESFFTPINEHDQLTADSIPKSPLILRPPSPDSDPCEITVCFAQKHEIRQVYVRSTARVFEIYYATNFQSDNEYLCTVRCGIASRGEEALRTNDVVFSAHSKGLDEGSGENLNGRNLNTNEDGWVEVKVSETDVFDDKNILPSISGHDPARIMQDYYEATAEITDANPCTSITLRLLSLQYKCCAHVDEVYVFADPVDSAENETGQAENSGSSLLTMLVPSLMQLSKFTGINKADDGHISYREERCKFPGVESKVNNSINISTKLAVEGKSHMVNQGEVKVEEENIANIDQQPAQLPLEVLNKHGSLAFARIENTLDQLVSRIDRMESFFSRLEENMLKPINSIEARLQRVEQHLEVMTKKSQSSTLPCCSRIVAPDFSCIGSDSNSFCVDGNDHPNNFSFEAEEMELHVDVPFVVQDNMLNSANSTPMLPTLVITAPEFSAGDDEEENDALKIEGDSLKHDEKTIMSIDDALASALAGFIVSTSIQISKDPQAPSTINTEFSNDVSNNGTASSRDQSETAEDHLNNAEEIHGTECKQDSALSYLSPNIEEDAIRSPSHNHCAKNSDELDHDCLVAGSDCALFLAEQKEGAEESKKTEIETSCDLDLEKVIMILPNVIDDDSDINQAESTGLMRKGSDIDIVHNVLGFTRCSSVVDFEYPLLDVKFVSLGNSCSKLSLEGLLVGTEKSHGETPCNEESEDASPPRQHYNSILVGEQFSMGPVTNGHFSVDLNYCNIMDGHPEPDGELGVSSTSSDGTYVSLI